MGTWQLYDAKNRLSALVDTAREDGPQTVTKHGRPVAVVLSVQAYEALRAAGNDGKPKVKLVDWLFSGPRATLPARQAAGRSRPSPAGPAGSGRRWDT